MTAKKVLMSLGMLAFVGSLVAAGTGAFFSDIEQSTGNVLKAGAIDLKIDNVQHYNGMICFDNGLGQLAGPKWHPVGTLEWNAEEEKYQLKAEFDTAEELLAAITSFNSANPTQYPEAASVCDGTWALADLNSNNQESQVAVKRFFNFNDIKPGDMGENTISFHIYNNDAWLCADVQNVTSAENDVTEPEGLVDNTPNVGELPSALEFFAWKDDGDNVYEQGEVAYFNAPVSGNGIMSELNLALADSTTGTPVSPEDTKYIGLAWCFGDMTVNGNIISCDGSNSGNETQTDSLSADLVFRAVQSRNNANFTCEVPVQIEV